VAKRRDSRYEAGLRSGAWQKMPVNRGQEFVIGGCTRGGQTFDALIFGYYDDDGRRIYVARTRNGLRPSLCAADEAVPAVGDQDLSVREAARAKGGRWGAGLTEAKIADCKGLRPALVGQFEFLEWTGENHLRHSRFIALRDDKRASE